MSSEQNPKDSLSFDNNLPHPWQDVVKAVWIKYPNKKIPQVLWERVIDIEKTENGYVVTKLKQAYQTFKCVKLYSLTTYDFQFKDQILNYREQVVKGLTKGLFKPLEISRYSAKDLESVDYIKTYFNLGSFSRMKSSFMQKNLEGIDILKELILNKQWMNLTLN